MFFSYISGQVEVGEFVTSLSGIPCSGSVLVIVMMNWDIQSWRGELMEREKELEKGLMRNILYYANHSKKHYEQLQTLMKRISIVSSVVSENLFTKHNELMQRNCSISVSFVCGYWLRELVYFISGLYLHVLAALFLNDSAVYITGIFG